MGVSEIELLAVSHAGAIQTVGVIDHAFAATVRLDASRATVYLTRSIDGIHNVHALLARHPHAAPVDRQRRPRRRLLRRADRAGAGPAWSCSRGPRACRDVWLSEIGPAGARGR